MMNVSASNPTTPSRRSTMARRGGVPDSVGHGTGGTSTAAFSVATVMGASHQNHLILRRQLSDLLTPEAVRDWHSDSHSDSGRIVSILLESLVPAEEIATCPR